jgi:DNA-binding transcriptional LysR family regulator
METLTFQELRIFSEVVRAGGITAAAIKLGVSKSVVSKQLSRLEKQLQVQLLTRSSRRVKLTLEGERLLSRIESILAEGERLIEDAHDEVGHPRGVVRIAASPEFGGLVVKRFFPLLLDKYPELGVTMKLAYRFEDLQDPAIDLAFRISHVQDDRLVARQLGEFRRIIIASRDYIKQHKIKCPADLESANCLIFSGDSLNTTWTLQNKKDPQRLEHVNVKGNMSVLGFNALLGVVESGAGVANVPEFITERAIKSGRIVHCLRQWSSQPAPVFIAYRFGAERIARVSAVIDEARKVIPMLLKN